MVSIINTTQSPLMSVGGLYEATHASQGKEGSATDVMNQSKLKIVGQG